jgi:hypothetical protein
MRITKSDPHRIEVIVHLRAMQVESAEALARFWVYTEGAKKESREAAYLKVRSEFGKRYKVMEDIIAILEGQMPTHDTTPEERLVELQAEIKAREAVIKMAYDKHLDWLNVADWKRRLKLWRDILESFQPVTTPSVVDVQNPLFS